MNESNVSTPIAFSACKERLSVSALPRRSWSSSICSRVNMMDSISHHTMDAQQKRFGARRRKVYTCSSHRSAMARDTPTGCASTFSDQTNDELTLVARLVGNWLRSDHVCYSY